MASLSLPWLQDLFILDEEAVERRVLLVFVVIGVAGEAGKAAGVRFFFIGVRGVKGLDFLGLGVFTTSSMLPLLDRPFFPSPCAFMAFTTFLTFMTFIFGADLALAFAFDDAAGFFITGLVVVVETGAVAILGVGVWFLVVGPVFTHSPFTKEYPQDNIPWCMKESHDSVGTRKLRL